MRKYSHLGWGKYVEYAFMILFFMVILWKVYGVNWLYGDKQFQSQFEKALSQGKISLATLFASGDTVCFLPPYAKPQSIADALPKMQLDYATSVIDGHISDGHWWLLNLTEKQTKPRLIKVTGVTRPNFKHGKCLPREQGVITLAKKDGYWFFDARIMQ